MEGGEGAARRLAEATLVAASAALTATISIARGRILFTSDEAMVGLMAGDILHHGRHPVFYQGVAYGGTFEPHILAGFFALLPETVGTYRLAMGCLLVATVLVVWLSTREMFGRTAGLAAGLSLAFGPPYFFWKGLTSDGAYTSLMLLGAFVVLFVGRAELRAVAGKSPGPHLLGAGLAGGLAWWVLPVSVVYVLPLLAFLVLGRLRRRVTAGSLFALASGFAIGSLPWWLENVRSGWVSLKSPTLAATAPGELAVRVRAAFARGIPTLFGGVIPSVLEPLIPMAPLVCRLLLLALLAFAAHAYRHETSPSRRGAIVGLGSVVVAPILLALAIRRTDFHEPRYLVPFYVGAAPLVGLAVSRLRRPISALALLVVPVVLHARAPRAEDFELAGLHSSREELVAGLLERGVTAVYTSYWTAYRLTFLSGRRIVGTPYGRYNETYRPEDHELVDASPEPAFLMQDGASVEWEARRFEAYLESVGATYRKETVAGLELFTGLPPAVVAVLRRDWWVPVAVVPGIVEWRTPPGAFEMGSGETRRLPVVLRNAGQYPWTPNVHVGYRWRDRGTGNPVAASAEGPRTRFAHRPSAGETVSVELLVKADVPPGRYTLVVDLVDENVAWFEEKTGTALRYDVTVHSR